MIRRAITFTGRVQGVGFRATARHCARGHPVTGWVRNEPDGSVRMQIQGDPAAVDAVLADLRSRMRGFIEQEHAADAAIVEDESSFEVRH